MTTLELTTIAVTDLLEVTTDLTTEENPEGGGGLQTWIYAAAAAGVMVLIGIIIIIIICFLRRRLRSYQMEIPLEEMHLSRYLNSPLTMARSMPDRDRPRLRSMPDRDRPRLSMPHTMPDRHRAIQDNGNCSELFMQSEFAISMEYEDESDIRLGPSTRRQGQSTRRQGQEISMPFFEDDFAEMSIIRKLMEQMEQMEPPCLTKSSEPISVDYDDESKETTTLSERTFSSSIVRIQSDPSDNNLTSQIGKSGTQRSSTRQASGYLDHLGGELSIPAHNVKLSIPPGALEDVEEISIEVFSDLPNGINLQDNEIAASFGFRCFPSGSSFKKPLTLSMPHCAVFYDNAVVEMVLHFGRDDEGEIMRIPLESNTYVIHSDRIVLQLDHFSWGLPTFISNWWNSGGNSDRQTTKRMLCTPFIPKTLPKDQDHSILRLCVYNKLPGLSEEILAEEMRMNYMQINPEEELIVNEDSIDMSISCKLDELPSTQTKDITTKELMQLNKLTVYMDLLKRRSLVTLIIKQERSLTMKFWTNIEEVSPSAGKVEGMITPVQALPLRAAPPRSPNIGYTHEESRGAVVPYVPPQEEESTQQGACRYQRRPVDLERDPDCLTDDQLVDISSKLPLDKFNPISIKLGFTMTETENIRDSSNKAEERFFTVLTRWKERTRAPKRQLIDVLRSVKLLGIVQSIGPDNDSPQEDID